jgi:hypothetical protein
MNCASDIDAVRVKVAVSCAILTSRSFAFVPRNYLFNKDYVAMTLRVFNIVTKIGHLNTLSALQIGKNSSFCFQLEGDPNDIRRFVIDPNITTFTDLYKWIQRAFDTKRYKGIYC